MLQFAWDYIVALAHYWWVIVIGLFGAINNVWKWFHPDRKDLPIPHWLRVGAAFAAIVAAQILVYRDSLRNLHRVIDDKRSLSAENWQLKQSPQSSATPNIHRAKNGGVHPNGRNTSQDDLQVSLDCATASLPILIP